MTHTHPSSLIPHPLLFLLCLSLPAHAQPPDRTPDDTYQPPAPERIYTGAEIAQAIGPPTLLTIHLHDVPPQQVFDAVTAQSGVRFTLPEQGLVNVSADCIEQPFWIGLASILQQTGFSTSDIGASACRLQRVWQPGSATAVLSGPKAVAGPFTFEIYSSQLREARVLNLERPAAPPQPNAFESNPLHLLGRIVCDPKVRILDCQTAVLAAVDDTGKSLNQEGNRTGGAPMVILKAPAPEAKTLTALSGAIDLQVAVHSERWNIPDLVKGGAAVKSFGPPGAQIAVTFQAQCEKPNDDSAIDLTIKCEANTALLWQFEWTVQDSLRWLDAQGNPIDFSLEPLPGLGGANQVTFRATCRPNHPVAEPTTFVLTVPTDIRGVEIPYNFTNLPLP